MRIYACVRVSLISQRHTTLVPRSMFIPAAFKSVTRRRMKSQSCQDDWAYWHSKISKRHRPVAVQGSWTAETGDWFFSRFGMWPRRSHPLKRKVEEALSGVWLHQKQEADCQRACCTSRSSASAGQHFFTWRRAKDLSELLTDFGRTLGKTLRHMAAHHSHQ